MKKISTLFLAVLTVGILFYLSSSEEDLSGTPPPIETVIKLDMESGEFRDLKKSWFKMLHQAEEGVEWQMVEQENMKARYKKFSQQETFRKVEEEIVPGFLSGVWTERGSNNNAGSVHAPAYNKNTDELFVISDGGALWKSNQFGEEWSVQNDFTSLDVKFLASFIEGENTRLVSAEFGEPIYSDDHGLTWEKSTGVFGQSNWSRIVRWVEFENSDDIFIAHKPDYWDNLSLYRSTDKGETFQFIQTFNTNFNNDVAFSKTHGQDDFIIAVKADANSNVLYKWNDVTETLDILNAYDMEYSRINIASLVTDSGVDLISYDALLNVHRSTNLGESWEQISTLPSGGPWTELWVSPSSPQFMLYGTVNLFRSLDGGETWDQASDWAEYYQDIENKIHADMMFFKEFERENDDPMILVSNHGGISKTEDYTVLLKNLSLKGHNVNQFYDVRSHPVVSNYVFAGSQDQGFQRGVVDHNNEETIEMDQVISGDYGHIEFTNQGDKMWMVYPGGWVSHYSNPISGGIDKGWTVESEDETVWIPPLEAIPDPNEDAVYLGGGNMDGGEGSHLIKLKSIPGGDIEVSQFDFDFTESNGTISAIAHNAFDINTIYVATTSGAFYTSTDKGATWERSIGNVTGGHFLYGSDIFPSRLDPNIIYYCGSGYSNPPVFVSFDGGRTFESMSTGLPSTLCFGMDANPEETLIFAATEAGPYVYVKELEEWFELGGLDTPAQRYWSVEYLQNDDIVRYGTYGRGIWDFKVTEGPMSTATNDTKEKTEIEVFPNPFTNYVQIASNNEGPYDLEILDMQGKSVFKKKDSRDKIIDLSKLSAGKYVLVYKSEIFNKSKIIIKA